VCGFLNDAQREKLHARVFHPQKSVRDAARFLTLKYAPDKVKSVLSTRYPVPSGGEKTEERIA
jgi:hypothetical protein